MSLGINLRVTGHSNQGGRKYMEDYFSVAYQASEIEKNNVEYAYFGIFDGHGGCEAAKFAKDHLLREIVNNKLFWSKYDSDVLRAIREGYISTHYAMWREQEKWPKTATGLPSTAGTTASVAFIFRKKIYIGHVGDSGIVLGYQEDGEKCWKAKPLTQDHKPECNVEKARIINAGGKVVTKSGVPRVVWNRPRIGHKGPVRRSTPFDEIPFLAVARSLGDLWSYNSALNLFIVSPEPDVRVIKIDSKTFRCLVFGTDGLWNVVTPDQAVDMARDAEIVNERLMFMGGNSSEWTNPSKFLVEKALERWSVRRMRADNTSVITVFLDQPGQPKKSVTGNNNGIIDRWSNTTRYELKYEMENEYNPEHVIYNRYNEMDSNDVLSSCHTENQQDYYYDQYGASSSTSIMDREHILSSSGHEINGNEVNNDCYSMNSLQYSPTSNNNDNPDINTMNGLFTITESYDKNMEGGYAFYENTIGLENSAVQTFKYHNTSSCDAIGEDDSFIMHNNTAVIASTANISALESSFDLTHQLDETAITAHQQSLNTIDPLTIDNHQHTTNVEVHNDSSNYSHSFAESYNSLLISSLESDNSSSNSSNSSSCSNNSNSSNSNCSSNSDSSGDEEFYDGLHHSYKSLNETGLAGHDRVFHHSPNSSNEEQQEQYQKACMLREDGYSLTKLETRVEQRLRSNYQNNSNNIKNDRGNDTCNNYNNNDNNKSNNININNDNGTYNSNNITNKDNSNNNNNNTKNNNNKDKNYINGNIKDITENDTYCNNNNITNDNCSYNNNSNNKLNDTNIFNNNIGRKNHNDNNDNNNNRNSNNEDRNGSNKIGDIDNYGDNNSNSSDGNSIDIYSSSSSCSDVDNKNDDHFLYEELQQPQTSQKQKHISIETFPTFTELSTEINNYNQYDSITSSYSINNDDSKSNFISSNNFESNLECNSLNISNSDIELSNHANQILNITSNNFTSVESSDDISLNPIIEMETEVLDEEIEDIESLSCNQNIETSSKDIETSTSRTTEYLLEESIQINEISSSNIEINSPIPSPSSNNFILEKLEIEPTNFDSIDSNEMELEKSTFNLKTITNNKLKNNNDKNNNKFNNNLNKNNIKTKILKLNCKTSFPPDKQNENENNTLNFIRRSLRSSNNSNLHINYNTIKKNTINNNNRRNNNNSLSKDMKAKKILNKNKPSNSNLTKTIVTKEFIKIVHDSTNSIPKNNTNIILAKLRSRPNNNSSNSNNNDNNNNNNININHNINNRANNNNKNNYNDSIRNSSQPSQSSENLIQTTEKVTVWSKRSRRIIQAISNNNNCKPNQKLNKALCTNNTANKNICNNNNNNSSSSVITSSSNNFNNNNSNSKISTNYRFQNNPNSNHKIQHQQNNSISSVSSTTSSLSSSPKTTTTNYISTKRSSTSRNSAWCPNKKSVQTRNRVQKR